MTDATPTPLDQLPEAALRQLDRSMERVATALADGLQAEDVAVLVRESVEAAEAVGAAWSGPEKRRFAVMLYGRLLDLAEPRVREAVGVIVRATDGPGPDALVDPVVERYAPPILMAGLRMIGPRMIDLVVEASAGRIDVNAEQRDG